MALPDGIDDKTKDEWLALAKSGDAAERKEVSNCLRALGYDPPMFLGWSAEDRVDKIMEHQGDGGGKKSSSSGKKGSSTSKKSSSSKGANKAKAEESEDSSSGSAVAVEVDLGPLTEQIEALEAKVTELTEAFDVQMDYVRETHTMMRVFFQSDEAAKNNLEELGNYFHGKLLGLEEEDGSEED